MLLLLRCPNYLGDFLRSVRYWETPKFAVGALQLDDSVCNAPWAYSHAMWNADAIRILELDARALVAVIQDGVDAQFNQLVVKALADFATLSFLWLHARHDHFAPDENICAHPLLLTVTGR
jgi:hypothetical protein